HVTAETEMAAARRVQRRPRREVGPAILARQAHDRVSVHDRSTLAGGPLFARFDARGEAHAHVVTDEKIFASAQPDPRWADKEAVRMRMLSLVLALGMAVPARARARSTSVVTPPGREPPPIKQSRRATERTGLLLVPPSRSPCGRHLIEL